MAPTDAPPTTVARDLNPPISFRLPIDEIAWVDAMGDAIDDQSAGAKATRSTTLRAMVRRIMSAVQSLASNRQIPLRDAWRLALAALDKLAAHVPASPR